MNATRMILAAAAMALFACATPDSGPAPTAAPAPMAAPTLAEVEADITRTYFTELPEWAA